MTVLAKKSKLPQNHSENSDKAHESSVSGFETTPKKTSKCYCVFHPEWLTEDGLLWLGKIDESTANCTVCRQSFSVKYEGKYAVTTHAESTKHKNTASQKQSKAISKKFCEEK